MRIEKYIKPLACFTLTNRSRVWPVNHFYYHLNLRYRVTWVGQRPRNSCPKGVFADKTDSSRLITYFNQHGGVDERTARMLENAK